MSRIEAVAVVLFFRAALVVSVTILTGCATVTIKKVPAPSQYLIDGRDHWTLEMQQEADRLEGFRFYLPRPFVNVFESFPVASDLYLARGRVSPDGRYVTIDSLMALSTREDFDAMSGSTARTLPGDLQIPQSWIFRPGGATQQPGPGSGEARSASENTGTGAARPGETMRKLEAVVADAREQAGDARKQSAAAKDAADQAAAAAGKAKTGTQQTTGQSARAVTNDNGAFAFQPLRGNFDLVYLPDFDEQYVVSSRSGLGNAQFQMNLGQGWSLQGFDSFTDNSALNKRVFDLIDSGLELGKAAARAAAMSAGIPLPGQARAGIEEPRGDRTMQEAPGTPVSLKIVVVHYAAKGLYPIIKPRELNGRGSTAMIMDLAAPTPALRRLGDADRASAMAEQGRLERRSTVPVYPYQYVSFDTFRYIAIELLTPQGLPFGALYDKTGTSGDPGDRRAAEPPAAKPSPRGSGAVDASAALDVAVQALENEVLATANALIADTLKEKPADQRPTAVSAPIRLGKDDTGNVVTGELRWSGPDDSMTDELRAKLIAAIDALLQSKQDLTTRNGGVRLRLSRGFQVLQVR